MALPGCTPRRQTTNTNRQRERELLSLPLSLSLFRILTVDVAVFALVVGAKAIARDARIMVDTPRANKAEILPRVAHVGASLVDILMLGGDQRNYRQQIGCCLPRAEHHIANAADKRFGDIFDTMQLLLRREACEWRHGMRIRCELGTVGRK